MVFKTADRLIFKGFIGPYLVAFFIVEFVLVMQFLWKYIDDILGRGYQVIDYLELIGLMSVTIIPLALPLTVLLSSVMVYGDLAEHYELSSLKSAGLSLTRILRPGWAIAIFTAVFSLLASNFFKPMANEQFLRKFNSMRLSKVTFALEEKVFNTDFKDHAIYVDKKDKDGRSLHDVLIYKTMGGDKSILDVISAKKAQMYTSKDGKFLVMDLIDGIQYLETKNPWSTSNYMTNPDRSLPINTASFAKYRKVFELADIFKDMSNLNLERKKFDMLNTPKLLAEIDSINAKVNVKIDENKYDYNGLLELDIVPTFEKKVPKVLITKEDSSRRRFSKIYITDKKSVDLVIRDKKDSFDSLYTILSLIKPQERKSMLDAAIKKNSSLKTRTWNNMLQGINLNYMKQDFIRSLHQQYSWALVCILLLFIGAPMGAIVRKGGFGYPMLVAIGFYMFFIILTILSERLQRSHVIGGLMAGWLPFLVLLPFAISTTYLALNDIKIDNSFLNGVWRGTKKIIRGTNP